MARSRLQATKVRETKKHLLLLILLAFVILFVIIKYGISFIANVALNTHDTSETQDVTQSNGTFIPAPDLTQSFTATNTASIKLSGSGSPRSKVKLYVNDKLAAVQTLMDEKSFVFDRVDLENGSNTLKAKTVTPTGESNYSNTIQVNYYGDDPELSLDFPLDNASFSKGENQIIVKGKTNSTMTVTVNGFQAIVDGVGNYSYSMQLKNGDNPVHVVAIDEAGNKKELERKVTYSQ